MNRLRAYRSIEGVSQDDLAATLGVSKSLVSAIESGRRSPTIDLTQLGYSDDRFELPEMTRNSGAERKKRHRR
jgi:transcriptional regulator with XRE-family HTH domain